jgi:glycine/D-amino acid oxidase-like deaminating enzyme
MAVDETRTTRFSIDLIEAAQSEAARESRSTRQQLDHWARLGMRVSMRSTVARRRIERALAGRVPLAALDDEERAVANAEIDVNIAGASGATSYADQLAREGVTTVTIDEDGRFIERRPDGVTTVL